VATTPLIGIAVDVAAQFLLVPSVLDELLLIDVDGVVLRVVVVVKTISQ
jgi:hypothetical protein